MNGCIWNSGGSNMSAGDSIEKKMDNQLLNRRGRNGLLENSVYTLLVYIQKGTMDYNFRLLCIHSQLF